MCLEVGKEEEKWVEGTMMPKPPRRAGKESKSLSKGPKAGLPVMAGSKQTLRTSSRCWKNSDNHGVVREI